MNLQYIYLMILLIFITNTFESNSSKNQELANLIPSTKIIQSIVADYAAEWNFTYQINLFSKALWEKNLENENSAEVSEIISAIDFSPDGKYLALGLANTTLIKIWDIYNKKIIQAFQYDVSSDPNIQSIKYSPCGEFLASSDTDGFIKFWSLKENRLAFCSEQDCSIISMSYSMDGKYLAYCTNFDKHVQIIDLLSHTKKTFSLNPEHDDYINMVIFSKNYLASCDKSNTLKLWKITNSQGFCKKNFSLKSKDVENLIALDISPCENFIALCGKSAERGIIKIINLAKNIITIFTNNITVSHVKFSKDSKHIYISDNYKLKIYDINSHLCIQILSKIANAKLYLAMDNLAISSDGKKLATNQNNGIINILINTKNELLTSSDLSEIFNLYFS